MPSISRLFTLIAFAASAIPFAYATGNPCPGNHFSYNARGQNICTPYGGGGPSSGNAPPGKSCPGNYYWHTGASCCVPKSPVPNPSPSCPSGSSWSKDDECCETPTPSQPPQPSGDCDNGDFAWIGLKGKCCIPHGGKPQPPSPPSGSSCPPSWYWHSGQGCCVPQHPSPPQPTCPSGSWWGNQCCNHGTPPPQPSGHYKRSMNKKRSVGMCPTGLEACPIGGLTGNTSDLECVDIKNDLGSCGGCSSISPEHDCNAIEGSWNVGCERGTCKVYSCQAGYKLARDGASCERLD